MAHNTYIICLYITSPNKTVNLKQLESWLPGQFLKGGLTRNR